MKMEARKRQGNRTDLTFTPVVSKLNTYEELAQESGESREQIRRFIRLTFLIKELLDMVDDGRIAFNSLNLPINKFICSNNTFLLLQKARSTSGN